MNTTIFALSTAVLVSAAAASPLLPGGSVSPVPVYPNTVNAATLVAGPLNSPFSSANFGGVMLSLVVTNCADNPYGLNALTFVYGFYNSDTSADAIGRLTVNGYTGFNTDVGIDPFSATLPAAQTPFEATRQADGSSVGWTWLNAGPFNQVGPSQSSPYLVVHTNATAYTTSTASLIDGAIATADTYAPLPTPGAAALLGLGSLAAFRRRR